MDALMRRCIVRLNSPDIVERSRVVRDLALAQQVGVLSFGELVAILGAGKAAREMKTGTYLECPLCGWVDKEGGDEYCPCGSKMMVRG